MDGGSSKEDVMMGKGRKYEIHLSVKYWKSKHFSSDLSITCNLDTYLRWHYVLENSRALNEKLDKLKARNIHATVEKEGEDLWVKIDLGTSKKTLSELDIWRIKNSVIDELMLNDTESLVTWSVPATGIDRTEVVKLMMEKSRKEMRSELWLFPDEDNEFIHYVYPWTRHNDIETCVQEVTKTLKEGERIELLHLIFSKIFEQKNVKQEIKQVFKVTMAVECLESRNKCRVILKGRMPQVEKGWSWIGVKFLDNYIVNEISFKDIKKLGTNISEEMIVEDVLSQPGFEHVMWYINESCEKIGICSTDRPAVDKATAALKRGIKREEFPLELYERLCDVQAVKEGRAILRKTDKFVQIKGTGKALTGIKQFIDNLESHRKAPRTPELGHINKHQDFKVKGNTLSVVVDDLCIQYPTNMSDVNLVVGVDTVPPEEAKFDGEQKTLHLPEWIDGSKRETEKTETCLRELLMFSLDKGLYKIQIGLPEVHKKVEKHFIHNLIVLLSGEEFKEKPPIQLFICTDSQDMYTRLTEFSKTTEELPPSVLCRPTHTSANRENASEYELGSEATNSIGSQTQVDGNVSDGGETNQARIHETGSDSVSVSETVGVYKEVDDSDSDETDSKKSDEARDILVIVTYKRKVRNTLESFSRPLDLNLNVESYLKWQYICCKPDLLQDRIKEMEKVAEKAEFGNDRLRLFLGKQRNDPNFDTLIKEIQTRFLKDADHLVVSWFPVHVSKSDEDIYNVLCKVLETSALQKRKEISTDLSESGLIRLVYDIRHTHDVSELIQTVIKKYDETLRQEYTSKQISLNAVLGQVFDQKQVNINASTKFASVRMKYEIDQSTNKVTVDLYGPQEEVKEMHTWLNKTYVTPYKYESLPFADIKIKDKYVDTAKVLVEHFKNQSYKDLFWTINDYTREVSLCSIHELEVMKAISDAKDCMECECITIENDSLEATEEIVKWLKNLGEFLERKVSLGITLERNEVKICITGGRVDAHSCIRRIKAYLREGGMQTK